MEIRKEAQEEMLRYWVWLSLVFGAGSTKLLHELQNAESPQEVYEKMQAGTYPGLTPALSRAVQKHSISEADSIVYFCRQHGIHLLPIDSAEYPQLLRNIGTPPVLLTAMGNLALLQNPLSLSVVGTRHPSPYTERVTAWITGELAKRGFTIVSGFAKGVDGLAHKTTLDSGGTTVAVLGCGINVPYPKENQALRDRMLSDGSGLFLSEYMPGTQPYPSNFPKRNRILSGLGYATAVMEAAERSGSLVTSQCAADQGRYLYCVPPADLFDVRYAGVIPLLRDGAFPLMHYEDVLLSYYSHFPQYMGLQEPELQNSRRMVYAETKPAEAPPEPIAETQKAKKQPALPMPEPLPAPVRNEAGAALPEDEPARSIVLYLRENGASYANDIAAALDIDLSVLLSELTMLELDGFADKLFGNQYRAV